MRMPIMDGGEAVRQIRMKEQETGALPTKIIAITAAVFEEERQRILMAGCDDFVGKPCSEAAIFDKIAQYLGTQYLYAQENYPLPATQFPRKALVGSLSADRLAVMPEEWITKLNHAARSANEQAIFQLLAEIPDSHAFLKDEIIQLVHNFQLQRLIQLTQL